MRTLIMVLGESNERSILTKLAGAKSTAFYDLPTEKESSRAVQAVVHLNTTDGRVAHPQTGQTGFVSNRR